MNKASSTAPTLAPALTWALTWALAFALLPALAHAGSAGNSFQVTATVTSACTVSGTTLNFGSSIDPLAAATPLDATSSLSVQCTNTTPYTVALNAGANAGGASNFGARTMKSGSNGLDYNLYADSSYATIWGDGSNATQLVSSGVTLDALGLAPTQNFYVYGRIPGRQLTAVPGVYSDTINVTLTYF